MPLARRPMPRLTLLARRLMPLARRLMPPLTQRVRRLMPLVRRSMPLAQPLKVQLPKLHRPRLRRHSSRPRRWLPVTPEDPGGPMAGWMAWRVRVHRPAVFVWRLDGGHDHP